MTQRLHNPSHDANMVLFLTPIKPSLPRFHKTTQTRKKSTLFIGMGSKIHPNPKPKSRLKTSSYDRMFRSVHLRFHFAGTPPPPPPPQRRDNLLRSKAVCPLQMDTTTLDHPPVALEERLSRFSTALNKLFKTRKGKTNLLPHQHRALCRLQQQQTFLIVPCDKNLGPAIIECTDYLKIAMRDHLSNITTYKSLSTSEIDRYSSEINKNILDWLKTHNKKLTKMERAFIREELK